MRWISGARSVKLPEPASPPRRQIRSCIQSFTSLSETRIRPGDPSKGLATFRGSFLVSFVVEKVHASISMVRKHRLELGLNHLPRSTPLEKALKALRHRWWWVVGQNPQYVSGRRVFLPCSWRKCTSQTNPELREECLHHPRPLTGWDFFRLKKQGQEQERHERKPAEPGSKSGSLLRASRRLCQTKRTSQYRTQPSRMCTASEQGQKIGGRNPGKPKPGKDQRVQARPQRELLFDSLQRSVGTHPSRDGLPTGS